MSGKPKKSTMEKSVSEEVSSESDDEIAEKNKKKKKPSKEKESSDSDDDNGKKNKKKNSNKEVSSESDDEIAEKNKKKKKPSKQKKPKRQQEFSDEVVPRVVLLGATGAGKSHLGNTLLGHNKFIVSDDPESCTSEASDIVRGFWTGDGAEFEIIDTPGLNDSEGRDTEHIQNIVENLREHKFVNMFLIVRNGHEVRMTNTYSDMLRTFVLIFGDKFWKHAMFDVSGSLKEKDKKSAKKWIREIREKFPAAKQVKSVFLDVEEEDEDFYTNVNTLFESLKKMPDFGCKDIKVVQAERDRLEQERNALALENEENDKKLKELQKAKIREQEEHEEKLKNAIMQAEKAREEERKNAEKEKKEEIQHLLDQVKEKETELTKIGSLKDTEVMKKDHELKLQAEKILAKEQFEQEKKELVRQHELFTKENEKEHQKEIEEKISEEKNKESEKNKHVQDLMEKIRTLTKQNEFSEVSFEVKKKYDAEKEDTQQKHSVEIKEMKAQLKQKDDRMKTMENEIEAEKTLQIQQEKEKKRKKEKMEREDLVQKNQDYEKEKQMSEQDFQSAYPALFPVQAHETPTVAFTLFEHANQIGRFDENVEIELIKEQPIINRIGGIAAHIYQTKYPQNMTNRNEDSYRSKIGNYLTGKQGQERKKKKAKVLMLLGLTGSGKTTFIDALTNYIFDTRYGDEFRLKLIRMTEDESAKSQHQSVSQTDNIVVYKIHSVPGMKVDYDLTVIDSPGFGDTRGVDYDRKLMQNIEDMFKSKKITHLDAIGFVAKAGDARLTAQQNYIFESILHIFGNDVHDNLISILTNHDGQTVNILDSFEKAEINFVQHFPVNSAAVFQPGDRAKAIDAQALTKQPQLAQYQAFFDMAKKMTEAIRDMTPRSLDKTIRVLHDRERIQVELQGVQERMMELLQQKDNIQSETDICNQHAANANANKDSEYEVEEQKMMKVGLPVGTYVTNCLICNRTCHYPCAYSNDAEKQNCSAIRGNNCTVCPQNCHWNQHVNNEHRIEFKVKKVKKTYGELIKRHADFIKKHSGQKSVVDALKAEADVASQEIQASVPKISRCLASLKENALRPNMSNAADYLDQMISAEEHNRKDGYQKRIEQLRIEKDKAKIIQSVQMEKDVMDAKK